MADERGSIPVLPSQATPAARLRSRTSLQLVRARLERSVSRMSVASASAQALFSTSGIATGKF